MTLKNLRKQNNKKNQDNFQVFENKCKRFETIQHDTNRVFGEIDFH